MVEGVESVEIYDERQAVMIYARLYKPHASKCERCGRKVPRYNYSQCVRLWRCCDFGGARIYIAIRRILRPVPRMRRSGQACALGGARVLIRSRVRGHLLLARARHEQAGLSGAHAHVVAHV